MFGGGGVGWERGVGVFIVLWFEFGGRVFWEWGVGLGFGRGEGEGMMWVEMGYFFVMVELVW